MVDSQLAPCPYCRSSKLHFATAAFCHKVVCEHCRASGPQRRTREDAQAEWNRVGLFMSGADAPASLTSSSEPSPCVEQDAGLSRH